MKRFVFVSYRITRALSFESRGICLWTEIRCPCLFNWLFYWMHVDEATNDILFMMFDVPKSAVNRSFFNTYC